MMLARWARCAALALLAGLGPVGVGAVARAAEVTDVPVPRVTIYPGDTVDESLLVERGFYEHSLTRTAIVMSRDVVVGKVARRTLLSGQPIPIAAVREPFAVHQGKPATILFRSAGLTITSVGLAMQSASVGEATSIRNVDSGIIVKGVVQADGRVLVAGP